MMKILRHTEPAAPEASDPSTPSPHPETCPWCGLLRVRGIISES